jgi:hypothetical protein
MTKLRKIKLRGQPKEFLRPLIFIFYTGAAIFSFK